MCLPSTDSLPSIWRHFSSQISLHWSDFFTFGPWLLFVGLHLSEFTEHEIVMQELGHVNHPAVQTSQNAPWALIRVHANMCERALICFCVCVHGRGSAVVI